MELDDTILAALAKVAGVSLTDEERADLGPRLAGLLGAAEKVNAFMASRREIGPAVRFRHLDLQDGVDR